MISFPCKVTDRVDFCDSLTKYLKHFDVADDTTLITLDVEKLQTSRESARTLGHGACMSDEHLVEYYMWLTTDVQSKFRLGEAQIRIPFCWYDGFRQSLKCTRFHPGFEQACWLFNYAALSSQRGIKEDRATVTGVKKACQEFQKSAGALVECQQLIGHLGLGILTPDLHVASAHIS